MKRVVVVFKSKYGSTKVYAQHIAKQIGCDCINMDTSKVDVSTYDIIIFGGGIYAGGINGLNLLKKQADKLQGKVVYIFTCGIADPDIPVNCDKIKDDVEKQVADAIHIQQVYMYRGALDYHVMSWKHKIMMKMMVSMVKKKPEQERSAEDENIIASYGGRVSYIDVLQCKTLLQDIEMKRRE